MAKHINAPFDTVAQPQARDISGAKPEITTMSTGEPEKDFGRPTPPVKPQPRPTPDKTPQITTQGTGEPEKQFGSRFAAPDFD